MVKNYFLGAVAGLAVLTASAQTVTTTYNFTGGIQTFTVPCGVDSITISCWGAQGGAGANGAPTVSQTGGAGAMGGYAQATFPVTAGSTFNVFVGGQGATPTGGFNGGANGGTQNAGGGGGASDVRFNGTSESDRIIVAGGGGGGGRGGCESTLGAGGDGGIGGGGNGEDGENSPTSGGDAGGGFGGVGSTGGGAGIGCGGFLGTAGANATGGTGGIGGAGQSCCCFTSGSIPGGGGGGGGMVGGGGGGGGSAGTTGCSGNDKGAGGGGAGGTSFTGSGSNASTNDGIWLGDGMVTISYEDPTPAAAIISGPSMVMCAGGQDTLTFSTPNDPKANFYTWTIDPALTFVSGQNTNTLMVTSTTAGTFTIAVTANDSVCGLQGGADTITVTVNALPTANASSAPAAICIGSTAVLMTTDSMNTYVWNPGNLTGMSVTVMPTTSTTYTATATDVNGCTSTATTMITVNQPPVVTLAAFTAVCVDDGALTLTGGSPAGGVYSGTAVTGTTFTPSTAGIGTHSITYTYTDANGCVGSDSAAISVNACTGIAGHVAEGSIAISPNPAADVITIGWNANSTVTAVKVMDAAGRVVMTQTAINGNTLRMDVSALPAGTYTVSTEGSVKTVQTFVKQ